MYLFFLYYGKIRKFESIIFHIDRLQKQIVVEWESLKKKNKYKNRKEREKNWCKRKKTNKREKKGRDLLGF